MTETHLVPFHGHEVLAIKDDDGSVNVPVRPICKRLHLAWSGQRMRIHRHPILQKGERIMRSPGNGGEQETLCLSLNRINFWLATIDSTRIKNKEIREMVELYQEKCADVLYAYFGWKQTRKPTASAASGLQMHMWDLLGLPILGGEQPRERILQFARAHGPALIQRYGSPLERLFALSSIPFDELIRRGLSFGEAFDKIRLTNQAILPYEQPRLGSGQIPLTEIEYSGEEDDEGKPH